MLRRITKLSGAARPEAKTVEEDSEGTDRSMEEVRRESRH